MHCQVCYSLCELHCVFLPVYSWRFMFYTAAVLNGLATLSKVREF